MGDPKGFLKIKRKEAGYRPVEERVHDYSEVERQLSEEERKLQASRCMDCGVPFCHWACPLGNLMPEWQDAVYRGDWKKAFEYLQETNPFPEFTGRVCPALCEPACVLSINDESVTIRQNELAIIEKAFQEGFVAPRPPKTRTGKKVAVVGGGPAGMAAADVLNRAGHTVTVFEAEDQMGGYLRFGIPDFKLDKKIIDRRLKIMEAEGVVFKTGVKVGKDLPSASLKKDFDAVCLTIGARTARDLTVEGRNLAGVHFAMELLAQQNKIVRGDALPPESLIRCLDKHVVVIGGGDTGSDCVGTANRRGAKKVTQLELLPQPSEKRTDKDPWPLWPKILKTSSSHEEGCERMWNIATKKLVGENGQVKKVLACRVEWELDAKGNPVKMTEVPGSEFEIQADLVLLAMGFVHAEKEGLLSDLKLKTDARGNIETDSDFMTSEKGVFAAGDAHRGAALIVWAIEEGRKAAQGMNRYLKK